MGTHNLCFRAKIRKNEYPCKPQFYYIKVRCKGVIITQTCLHDVAFSSQVEQQDQILMQLQQELRAERDRHQDTGRALQTVKRNNGEMQEDIENSQKDIKDLTNKVCIG